MLPAIYFVLITLTIWSDAHVASVTDPVIFATHAECRKQAATQFLDSMKNNRQDRFGDIGSPTAFYHWCVPSKNLGEEL